MVIVVEHFKEKDVENHTNANKGENSAKNHALL